MTKQGFILVFDHGTTGIRACILNLQGNIIGQGYQKFPQIYPKTGWVEHNAQTLWDITPQVAEEALKTAQTSWDAIQAIGLTNQRETVVLWDAETGKPIHNAIVWQCRRTSEWCETLKEKGFSCLIQKKTGLVIDPYFSASKIRWLLDHVPEAQALLKQGKLLFGTVDTWILWNLSGGKVHVSDPTNASRTMLYNIQTQQWDDELLDLFGVPTEILPDVKPSNQVIGTTAPRWTGGREIPLAGVIGDQQAALYGQKCWESGTAKSTYGTGAFLMMNLGNQPVISQKGLLTTVGCNAVGNPAYAFEGSIFTAGATLEWLQKGLGLIQSGKEADELACSLEGNGGVYLVPAFVGLGAPYWDASAKAAIIGLTQGASRAHIARAALEAMVYQTREVLDVMQEEGHLKIEALRIDGGVSQSHFLAQFLADILNIAVLRSSNAESTAIGSAYLAGLAVGYWDNPEVIRNLPETLERFEPKMESSLRESLYQSWIGAVGKVLTKSKVLTMRL